jgi:WD repeat-containing protein 26
MLPEHRLDVLLAQAKDYQISNCLYHTEGQSPSLYADHVCDRTSMPSETIAELDRHTNEVWQVRFSHDGTRLASCGADPAVLLWDVSSFEVIHTLDAKHGVGNLAWSPDDTMIITCGRDKHARLWNTEVSFLGADARFFY